MMRNPFYRADMESAPTVAEAIILLNGEVRAQHAVPLQFIGVFALPLTLIVIQTAAKR